MNPDIRRKLLWSIMFALLLYVAIVFFSDVQRLANDLTGWPWEWLPVVIGLTLVNYVGRLFKWQWYLRLLEIPISTYDTTRIFGVGMLMVMTPGKAGEFLKSYMVKNVTDTSMSVTAPIILAERITDGISMLLLASVGLIIFPHPVARGAAIFTFIAFTLFIGIIQSRALSMRCLELGQQLPVIHQLASKLTLFYESSYTIFKPRNLIISLVIGLISWAAEGLAYFVVLVGFGQPSTVETALIAIFIFSISVVIGAIVATPGGLGGVEGSLVTLSVQILGMTGSVATAAALLIRFCTLWFGVLIGVTSFILWSNLLAGSADLKHEQRASAGD